MSKTAAETLKEQRRAVVREFSKASDATGLFHVLITVIPFVAFWVLAAWSVHVSLWITAGATAVLTILMLRVFSLMHDCGHGSLFRTQAYNRFVGFFFGVSCGMPQYVWSAHHHYHHQTNGNWDKYRGPISTLSYEEYAKLTPRQQWIYRNARNFAFAPLAGFVYLIFNPRFNWIRGSIALVAHVIRRKIADPTTGFRAHAATFQTRLWKTPKEYHHQTANNLVLLSSWAVLSWAMGPAAFFAIFLTSVSLAGAIGIALFTVQHNFENAYASTDEDWDIDTGSIEGTSFLVLPGWLNWATANIGYHHIHHLSASIPSYRLIECHERFAHLFTDVKRISMWQVPAHLKCILWDTKGRRITSVREYDAALAASTALRPAA